MIKKNLAIAILAALVFISCSETNKQEKKEGSNNSEVTESKKENETNPLVGSWTQPNPINDKEVQGFKLQNDGSAESINMATLVYKKWWGEKGKLTLVFESIGTGTSSIDTITYDVIKITDKELELKNGEVIDKYAKQ